MNNGAGIAVDLSRAQRILGYDADVCMFNPDPYGWESDKIVRLTEQKHMKTISGMLFLLKQLDYDFYHRHGYFVKWGLEGGIFRLFRKKQVVHFHGSDVRGRKVHSRRRCFVSTPDLLKHVENSIWIPNPVRPEPFLNTAFHDRHEKELVIGYYKPTYDQYVPTKGLEEASSALERQGYRIRLRPLQKTSHDRVAEYYPQIDVWVDRFGLDSYGLCAVEAALSGKPVIAQIGNDELAQMDGCPFINIREEAEIGKHMQVLASNVSLCRELGKLAREYALRTHDWMKIAALVISEYEALT